MASVFGGPMQVHRSSGQGCALHVSEPGRVRAIDHAWLRRHQDTVRTELDVERENAYETANWELTFWRPRVAGYRLMFRARDRAAPSVGLRTTCSHVGASGGSATLSGAFRSIFWPDVEDMRANVVVVLRS